ncbi:MAG: hypothetical protein Q8O67_05135 [Deltaproteobacteria bacterium]|nr:hypothetical protein [Deltaproteobacteria bacterium]
MENHPEQKLYARLDGGTRARERLTFSFTLPRCRRPLEPPVVVIGRRLPCGAFPVVVFTAPSAL